MSHRAYRTSDRDFEIRIADGAKPLPLKPVVIDTINADRPHFGVSLDWSDNPVVATTEFDVSPPTGSPEIPPTGRANSPALSVPRADENRSRTDAQHADN